MHFDQRNKLINLHNLPTRSQDETGNSNTFNNSTLESDLSLLLPYDSTVKESTRYQIILNKTSK